QPGLVEFRLEAFAFEHILEQVLEASVIGLDDRVLGRKIDRPAPIEPIIEARPRKIPDRIVEIVHRHGDAAGREVEHFAVDDRSVFALEYQSQLALAGDEEIGRPVLVAERMAADHDRVGPAGHKARHVGDDDRLAENDAAQYVADRAIGRLVHFLEAEFLYAGLI